MADETSIHEEPWLESLESGCLGFRATQMEGPGIDLVALAGLTPTDDQHDALIDCDWEEVVSECGGTVVEKFEFEGGPGQSDTYYDVEIDDPARFVDNLRRFYLAFLRERSLA